MIRISVYQIKKYAAIVIILRDRKTIAVVTNNFQVDTLHFFPLKTILHFATVAMNDLRLLLIQKSLSKTKKSNTRSIFFLQILSKQPKGNKI